MKKWEVLVEIHKKEKEIYNFVIAGLVLALLTTIGFYFDCLWTIVMVFVVIPTYIMYGLMEEIETCKLLRAWKRVLAVTKE